jgi:DNA invertase Pin-like site-specific DNA recombinase
VAVQVGYARVSTLEQNLDLQLDALDKSGCQRVFKDTTSGARSDRQGLRDALDYVREGDVLVVWKLDRLGRGLRHLIDTITSLDARGVGFKSLQESLDTTTSGGRLIFHIFGALAEFERELIRERTMAGLHAARARGREGGRPQKLDGRKLALARSMMQDKTVSVTEVAKTLGVNRSTLYRALARAQDASLKGRG